MLNHTTIPAIGFGITIIQLTKYQTWEGIYLTHLYDHVNAFLKEKQSLLETQEEGTVFPSLKKYNISNCNMLNASWHKCKNATSKMSAGTPRGFTWFKRFMRKNYFTSFRASWKQQHQCGGQWKKRGKGIFSQKKLPWPVYSCIALFSMRKNGVRHPSDFKLWGKMNEQSLPWLWDMLVFSHYILTHIVLWLT